MQTGQHFLKRSDLKPKKVYKKIRTTIHKLFQFFILVFFFNFEITIVKMAFKKTKTIK